MTRSKSKTEVKATTDICRFCLKSKGEEKFQNIEKEKLVDGILSIEEVLTKCSKIDLNVLENYKQICVDCISKITEFHKFYEECIKSYEILLKSESELQKENATDDLQNEVVAEIDTADPFQESSDIEENDLKQEINEAPASNRSFNCPICNKAFQTISNRNTHIQSHNPAESFKCSKCEKTFKSKVYLSKHVKFVHSISEHECKICNKTFINAAKYKYHARAHDVSKQYHCKFCERSFIQIHHLQNHERIHTGLRPFLCTVCGQGFKVSCNLKLHMRVHENDRKFVCEICSKDFIQQSTYKMHMKTHSNDGQKEYQCEHCGKSFIQKSSLTVHLRIHSQEKKFECDKCDKKFIQRHQLNYHLKALHLKKEKPEIKSDAVKIENVNEKHEEKQKKILPYICTTCDKRFKVPSSLLAHTKIHNEDRKHACDQCNAKFKRREHLRIHVNGVHLKLKPFKCEICGRTFSQAGDRNIHMKSHNEDKEHTCTICDKKFRLLKALRTHARIHTGEKPFSCPFCKQSFMTYMAMAAHTEKCQVEVTSGRLFTTTTTSSEVNISESDNKITVITIPVDIPDNVVLTVPIT
uniref:CSON015472 protein n=1 Tax=Culicoides sonorensis TaxID=179676 RepID=A0A336MD81_CULSO